MSSFSLFKSKHVTDDQLLTVNFIQSSCRRSISFKSEYMFFYEEKLDDKIKIILKNTHASRLTKVSYSITLPLFIL